MKTFRYTVPAKDNGKRLQDFLRGRHRYSHRLIVELKRGGMAVNGAHRRMVDPVFEGDRIEITFQEEPCALVPNGSLAVPVVYEDEDLVIFDKPADMSVHPAAEGVDDSLGNFFAYRYRNELTFRPVSRLDKNTTGLCMSAKSTLSAGLLIGQVEKEYLAIAEGLLPNDEGVITVPIGRVEGSIILRKPDPDGQSAVTHYRVLQRTNSHTLVSVQLETGRTHQIRVHFAWLGHPLAGDSLYGGHTGQIGRQALHCAKMSFLQPFTQNPIDVSSPIPADMAALLAP
ncbi:MAG: RluA family pseudouridine synthase [Candidatus Merdivicinus sp.]